MVGVVDDLTIVDHSESVGKWHLDALNVNCRSEDELLAVTGILGAKLRKFADRGR